MRTIAIVCCFLFLALLNIGGDNEDVLAKISADLKKEENSQKIIELIEKLVDANHYDGVDAIIAKLDNKQVIGKGPNGDFLVCDFAAQSLQRMLGINYGRIKPLYLIGTRDERDKGIDNWKKWWDQAKDIGVAQSIIQHIDGLVKKLNDKSISIADKRKVGDNLQRSLGTDFGIIAFSNHQYFTNAYKSSSQLAQDWWKTHRNIDLATIRKHAQVFDTFSKMANKYRRFAVEEGLLEDSLPLKLQANILEEEDKKEVDKLIQQLIKGSADEKRKSAKGLKGILGTDFGYLPMSVNKTLKTQSNELSKYIVEWWKAHRKTFLIFRKTLISTCIFLNL